MFLVVNDLAETTTKIDYNVENSLADCVNSL